MLSAVCILAYANIPSGANTLLLVLGFPLGFCMSAIFSGFGSFLSELYPTAVRGTGQGFTYNTGRAVGAVFPTLVGFLADSWGVGGALVFGAIGYAPRRAGAARAAGDPREGAPVNRDHGQDRPRDAVDLDEPRARVDPRKARARFRSGVRAPRPGSPPATPRPT